MTDGEIWAHTSCLCFHKGKILFFSQKKLFYEKMIEKGCNYLSVQQQINEELQIHTGIRIWGKQVINTQAEQKRKRQIHSQDGLS